MPDLSDISVIKDIMTRHGFNFSKSLGQNFLINPSVCPKMAENCGIDENTGVIEIGPGIGVLTKELALRAKKVVAIELDERLPAVLSETLGEFDNVEIINADVLKTDLQALIKEKFSGMNVVVCANLPYYITSPVIMYLLESRIPVKAITLMIQKEVADRLCAQAGSRDAGAITISVNYFSSAQKLFDVSRGSFMPAPNVDSSVIRLDIKKEPDVFVSDEKNFFRMVKAAFGMRRKTALNAISAGMAIPKPQIAAALQKSGLDLNIRAEKMTMEQLALLSENIEIQ